WRQMFAETTRLMAENFWRADTDGVDFAAVTDRWRPVVEQVRSHDDLVDVLWETVAELNTSHAYVLPADPPGDADRRLGLLGADLVPTEEGWRIERILPGESSDPGARSPLLAAGVGARPGDLVVAVDGAPAGPVAAAGRGCGWPPGRSGGGRGRCSGGPGRRAGATPGGRGGQAGGAHPAHRWSRPAGGGAAAGRRGAAALPGLGALPAGVRAG